MSDQPRLAVDQSGQTVQGNQTNVAGDININAEVETHPQALSDRFYAFILALVAIIALVIIALAFQQGWVGVPTLFETPTSTPGSAASTTTPIPTNTSEPPATQTDAISLPDEFSGSCLADYGTALPQENIKNLEVGISGTIMERNEHKLLVLRLTENRVPIGLIHFQLFPEASSFKIETLLDAQCMTIPPSKDALDNWEVVEFDLNGVRYGLKMGFHGTVKRVRTTGLRRM